LIRGLGLRVRLAQLRHEKRNNNAESCHENRDMPSAPSPTNSVLGRRMREQRDELGWSQEKMGVAIGLDESSARARISRYELGVHEPAMPTARLIAEALRVPLIYLYCEDDGIAALLLALHRLGARERDRMVKRLVGMVEG
jgi:transcriptional regulator with XRE-family HTH domain